MREEEERGRRGEPRSQKTIDIGHQRKVGGKKSAYEKMYRGWPLLDDTFTNYVCNSGEGGRKYEICTEETRLIEFCM